MDITEYIIKRKRPIKNKGKRVKQKEFSDELLRLYKLGLSRTEISKKVGYAYSTVCTYLGKIVPAKVLRLTRLSDESKGEIKTLLLENKSVAEISKKLNLHKYQVEHYYRRLIQLHGDRYKLETPKTVFEKFEEDGIGSLSDTKMGKYIQTLEIYNIKFKLSTEVKKNRNVLLVTLNCSGCGKELSKNFTALQSCVKLLELNDGKIHCLECYKENAPGFSYKRIEKPTSKYWGIQLRKQTANSENISADIIMKINSKTTYIKGFSNKKFGENYILFAALFRDCYIILNDLPNARNFSDEELFELLKKYDMMTEYNEVKNKLDNLFNDLFVEE